MPIEIGPVLRGTLAATFFDAYFFCTLSSFVGILEIRKTVTFSANV